ncbi:MAG: IS200/IS605 family transposase [Bacteroidetes bacterium]|nr:MAG: IS200/IS605 family transposase [Bacteroidota bacterium]
MANTYTQLYVHIVFAVKGRQNIIPSNKKEELYKYITGIFKNKKNKLLAINGMSEHIHILLNQNPEDSLSSLVKEIKRCSSLFINEKKWMPGKFEWQSGYSGFTYSKSQISSVCKYIENQEQHHKKRTFREEYIEILKKFAVDYNEKYIFDDVVGDIIPTG